MKKSINLLIVVQLCLLIIFPTFVSAETTISSSGYLIKTANNPAIYYVGIDNKRHLFPNASTFWSYYTGSWSKLKINYRDASISTISQSEFDNIEAGTNMTVKPGSRLIRFQNSGKIYTVFSDALSKHNLLKSISSEDCRSLFGSSFKCQDKAILIQDGFAADYVFDKDEYDEVVFTDLDHDGISDWDEIYLYGSDETKKDTDGDGYSDAVEPLNNYNPIIYEAGNEKINKEIVVAVTQASNSLELKRANGNVIDSSTTLSIFHELDRMYCEKATWGVTYDPSFYKVAYYGHLCGDNNFNGDYYCADSNGFRGFVKNISIMGLGVCE